MILFCKLQTCFVSESPWMFPSMHMTVFPIRERSGGIQSRNLLRCVCLYERLHNQHKQQCKPKICLSPLHIGKRAIELHTISSWCCPLFSLCICKLKDYFKCFYNIANQQEKFESVVVDKSFISNTISITFPLHFVILLCTTMDFCCCYTIVAHVLLLLMSL